MAPDDSGQGGFGPGQPVRRRLRPGWGSLLAVAALGLGLAALGFGLAVLAASETTLPGETAVLRGVGLGVAAVVLGAVAFLLVRARGQRGRGLAVAGLVAGGLGVLCYPAAIGAALFGALRVESGLGPAQSVSAVAFSRDATMVITVSRTGTSTGTSTDWRSPALVHTCFCVTSRSQWLREVRQCAVSPWRHGAAGHHDAGDAREAEVTQASPDSPARRQDTKASQSSGANTSFGPSGSFESRIAIAPGRFRATSTQFPPLSPL